MTVETIKAIQRHLGIPDDGIAGPQTWGAVAKALGLHSAVAGGEQLPDDYWPMLAKIESGNRPYVKAQTSSASGLYQFIRSTWIGEGGQWGPDNKLAFGGLKPSEAEQLERAKSFTAKNAAILRAKGIPINRASLYAAHFFGAGMAAKVIGADVDARADLIAGEAATNANPSILRGKTVGQFLTWLHGKTGEWAR
jgi:hypothetical protein